MAQESWKRDQEETGCQPPEGPVLCANNCGFFGSTTTMNFCSKCYKNHILKHKAPPAAVSKVTVVEKSVVVTTHGDLLIARADQADRQLQPEVPVVVPVASASVDGAGSSVAGPSQPQQPQPNRCFSCKKRVGLTGFKCRCGNTFCSLHRYSDKHSCSFDYKTAGRDAIAKANPVVKADKIDKI